MTVKSNKPIARCFADDDGKEYQEAYFDGYSFGDRLLEGVMFKAELLPDGYLEVSTAPRSASYMKKLNEKEWLDMALDHAINNDIFCENEKGSGEEIFFVPM